MVWKKGQSGNPGGRTKANRELVDALQAAVPVALSRLVELIGSADEKVAVAAAKTVLDRCNIKVALTGMTLNADQAEAILRQQAAAGDTKALLAVLAADRPDRWGPAAGAAQQADTVDVVDFAPMVKAEGEGE